MNNHKTLELPPGIPATDSEREQNLIEALDQCPEGRKRAEVLWKLSRFYHYQAYRSDLANSLVDLMTNERDGDKRTAAFHLAQGQKAQAQQNWGLALVEALKANPFNLKAAERLRQLLIDYPTLPMQSPWIQLELDLLERG